ncbi:2199_t:CDS:2, partial [Dentiscutata heterogama]
SPSYEKSHERDRSRDVEENRALKEENSALRSQVTLLEERLEHLERTQSNVLQSSAVADLLTYVNIADDDININEYNDKSHKDKGRENSFSPGKSYDPTQTRFKHEQLKEVLRAAKQLAHKNLRLLVNENKSWLHQRDFVELTILLALKKRINKSLKYLDEEVVQCLRLTIKAKDELAEVVVGTAYHSDKISEMDEELAEYERTINKRYNKGGKDNEIYNNDHVVKVQNPTWRSKRMDLSKSPLDASFWTIFSSYDPNKYNKHNNNNKKSRPSNNKFATDSESSDDSGSNNNSGFINKSGFNNNDNSGSTNGNNSEFNNNSESNNNSGSNKYSGSNNDNNSGSNDNSGSNNDNSGNNSGSNNDNSESNNDDSGSNNNNSGSDNTNSGFNNAGSNNDSGQSKKRSVSKEFRNERTSKSSRREYDILSRNTIRKLTQTKSSSKHQRNHNVSSDKFGICSSENEEDGDYVE